MNDEARLRLEFIAFNGHHKLTITTWVGHTTAAGLCQCLITSIMNGDARLRLEIIACNDHHKLTFVTYVECSIWLVIPTIHTKIAFHSQTSLLQPMSSRQ
eukprot:scaffold17086_cov38-Cyclotella_meneghiniana.AAC.1